jgi:hypothetical protein
MFDYCIKHKYDKVSIGSFFHIASEHAIVPHSKSIKVNAGNVPISDPPRETDIWVNTKSCEVVQAQIKVLASINVADPIKVGPWSKEIEELEDFFQSFKLPLQCYRLNDWTLIRDPALSVESSLCSIKSHNGNIYFEPYLERLRQFKTLLSQN